MIVGVSPDNDSSRSSVTENLSIPEKNKSWYEDVFTRSRTLCDHKPGQSCIHVEKVSRVRFIGFATHYIYRVKTSDGFIMLAFAFFDADSWKHYQKEIKASFESITFSPSVARRIYEQRK